MKCVKQHIRLGLRPISCLIGSSGIAGSKRGDIVDFVPHELLFFIDIWEPIETPINMIGGKAKGELEELYETNKE